MLTLREMATSELERIIEIDVSEHGTLVYQAVNGQLESTAEEWDRPRWNTNTWRNESWTTLISRSGIRILGAFDEERLVGIAVLRPHLTESMGQLAALFVSKDHRRMGIAQRLTDGICDWAKETGARSLYVSATPSESAVGFYSRQGFRLTDQVHPELFALEPEDIHMVKPLGTLE